MGTIESAGTILLGVTTSAMLGCAWLALRAMRMANRSAQRALEHIAKANAILRAIEGGAANDAD